MAQYALAEESRPLRPKRCRCYQAPPHRSGVATVCHSPALATSTRSTGLTRGALPSLLSDRRLAPGRSGNHRPACDWLARDRLAQTIQNQTTRLAGDAVLFIQATADRPSTRHQGRCMEFLGFLGTPLVRAKRIGFALLSNTCRTPGACGPPGPNERFFLL